LIQRYKLTSHYFLQHDNVIPFGTPSETNFNFPCRRTSAGNNRSMRCKKVIYRPRLQRQGALVDKLISYWPLSVNYGCFLRPAEALSVKFPLHIDGIPWVSANMCGCTCVGWLVLVSQLVLDNLRMLIYL